MPLRRDEQKLSVVAQVELITIDARPIGGSQIRITPAPRNGAAVVYKGLSYQPLPLRITGVRYGGKGGAGEPTLEVAVEDTALLALVAADDNLTGAVVSRLTTMETYLDGAPGADTTQHWPEQKWRIETRIGRDEKTIRWRLASPLTLDGAMIPRRQALRDVCGWEYRRWSGTAWVVSRAECPYRGAAYFDIQNRPTTDPARDVCNRRISGCQKRYPNNAVLPFGGFVGLGRRKG